MLRQPARVCLFCETRSLLSPSSTSSIRPVQSKWNQVRAYGQVQRPAQRRRPSRMELSHDVARPPPSRTPDRSPRRRAQPAFSGLNRTRAPPSLTHVDQRETKGRFDRNREARRDGSVRPPSKQRASERSSGSYQYKALEMQKILTEIPYNARNKIKKSIQEVERFDDFPLLPTVLKAIRDALPGLDYINPTPAQKVAIPAILGVDGDKRRKMPTEGMEQFLLAAETGSGKTLAYLLPAIDAIKRQEAKEAREEAREKTEKDAAEATKKRNDIFDLEPPPLSTKQDPARPRLIILVPTAELVNQVGSVAKSLSHVAKFKTAPISAANSATVIRNRLFSPIGVDVLISTPQLLASIAESNPNILSRVTHMVIDEADSLFDRSFGPSTEAIIDKSTPSLRQLILCSATIPRRLDKTLQKSFPDVKRLVTPNLHAIPRRVQLGVVDVNKEPYRGNKDLACADTIWTIGSSVNEMAGATEEEKKWLKRIIVFVNERTKTHELAQYLVSKGIDAEALNRDTPGPRQAAILNTFTSAEKVPEDAASTHSTPTYGGRKLANTKVIVTTDLGSRGIDTLEVRHVVLYDVPHTSIDFIHRLGRTGRMGRRGRGIVLVGRGDRTDVVKEVKDAMFRGLALV